MRAKIAVAIAAFRMVPPAHAGAHTAAQIFATTARMPFLRTKAVLLHYENQLWTALLRDDPRPHAEDDDVIAELVPLGLAGLPAQDASKIQPLMLQSEPVPENPKLCYWFVELERADKGDGAYDCMVSVFLHLRAAPGDAHLACLLSLQELITNHKPGISIEEEEFSCDVKAQADKKTTSEVRIVQKKAARPGCR